MSKNRPAAAKGAFDRVKLRLMPDGQFINLANEFTEVIQLLRQRGTEHEIEGRERAAALLKQHGLKDFEKARKQVSQEYQRRYAEFSQTTTMADLRDAMIDIEFERRQWTPFQRSYVPPLDLDDPKQVADIEQMEKAFGQPREDIIATLEEVRKDEIWLNSKYQVNIRRGPAVIDGLGTVEAVHLSIKRIDKRPCRDWRDFQRIKDELLGRNCEAVELFPAQRRLVDTANQYHLWGFLSTEFQFPFGFEQRVVDSGPADPESVNMRQRPVAEGYHVEDTGIEAEGAEDVRLVEQPE